MSAPSSLRNVFNTLVVALTTALILSTSLAGADAQARSTTYDLDLPAQSLDAALQAVALASQHKLLYRSELVLGKTSPALKGAFTTRQAMEALLSGTDLQFEITPSAVVLIHAKGASKADGAQRSDATQLPTASAMDALIGPGSTIRLAQAEPTAARTSTQAAEAPAQRREESLQESVELGEVVVTGSHIRGVENNTVPLIVLDKAYIESTGYSTTTRLIESLPQNFALNSQSGVLVPETSGANHQGSSVNLRGVGQGTTLVLLNGRRMAPGFFSRSIDISALPLSAIERVEVMTDGASALYGSDAIGGVVNFVLRDDFEGAETRLRSGWADAVDEYRVSQALGNTWSSGNALLSLEYYKRNVLLAKDRDFVPSASLIGSLLPQDSNYSGIFSGRQHLSETLSLFFDALYTQRDTYNFGGRRTQNLRVDADNSQIAAALGAAWQVGGDWQIEAAGSYARNRMDLDITRVNFAIGSDPAFDMRAAQVKTDGAVLSLPGGPVRVAIGAEWRTESFRYSTTNLLSGAALAEGVDSDRIIRSAFGEIYVPIVGAGNATTAARRLELSLAGRFDDYSIFGSSFDPQVGLMWEPIDGLRLRGSRGSSYKAPDLTEYNTSIAGGFASFAGDPDVPSGVSYQLWLSGADVTTLGPQESDSSSFGLEFAPPSIQGLQLSFNYYKIEYTGRIAPPGSADVMLANPAAFGGLIVRNPSDAQVNAAIAFAQLGQGFEAFDENFDPDPNFTPASVDVLIDLRTRNLSVTNTSGLDLSIHYDFGVAGGNVQLGLDGTHIYELKQQVTSSSAPFDRVDTIYNPPAWRARGSAGWQRQGWAANLFVNYTDSYVDNRRATPAAISSYTTLDARLAYEFEKQSASGFLSGVTLSANVQNVFDRDPPSTAITAALFRDMGFDPTNANPLGRFIAIEVTKTW